MRNMSFALTTEAVRARTKTVTRRTGWRWLTPGTLIQPVVKGMGLKPGEQVQRINGPIRVVTVSQEPLSALLADLDYGFEEVRKEGFADHPLVQGLPGCFVEFFRNSHAANKRPALSDLITRIEFEYVEDAS